MLPLPPTSGPSWHDGNDFHTGGNLNSTQKVAFLPLLAGLAEAGFTIAIFDTAAKGATARLVAPAADICLLPTRPTRLDVDVTAATFRAACLAERKAALLLTNAHLPTLACEQAKQPRR